VIRTLRPSNAKTFNTDEKSTETGGIKEDNRKVKREKKRLFCYFV